MDKKSSLEKDAILAQMKAEEEIESKKAGRLNINAKKRVAQANAQTQELTAKIKELNEEHFRNRTEAVLELKTNVDAVRAEVATQAEKYQKKQERKKKQLEDEKESLLAQGLNPYVEFRKKEIAEEAESRERRLRAAVEKNKSDLAAQLAKEQKFLDKQEQKKREALAYEKQHRESLGRHVIEERNRKYIVERTSAHTEVLDPSGKAARVDPSQITDIPDYTFGLGKSSRIPKESMRRITEQIRAELRVDEEDLGEFERLVSRLRKVTGTNDEEGKGDGETLARSISAPVGKTQTRENVDGGDPNSAIVNEDDLERFEMLGNTNGLIPGTDKTITNLNLRGDDSLKSTLLQITTEEEGTVAADAKKIESLPTPKYQLSTLTKFERDALDRAKERHADRIEKGVPQIAGGKVFQGDAFASTPATILFKDFDVGRSYKQRFVLTNVSYTFNSFKILDLDDDIMDFFVISFEKPGRMSAGMSCSIEIVFKPQLNHDIYSHIRLLTETGEVRIPLQCLIKRCAPRVLSPKLDFAEMVIGQRSTLPVKIVNSQALPTRFTIEAVIAAAPANSVEGDAEDSGESLDREDTAREGVLRITTEGEAQEAGDEFGDNAFIGKEPAAQEAELKSRVNRVMTAVLRKKRREQAQPFVCYLSSNKSLSPTDEGGSAGNDDSVKEVLVTEGVLAGYDSVTLTVRCAPLSVGTLQQQFVVRFHQVDEAQASIDEQGVPVTREQTITAQVIAAEIPIFVEDEVVDLKCVLHERVYRRKLVVKNRGKTACRLQMKVMRRFQQFVDVSPAVFFVQANSSQSVNIKFTPSATIVNKLAHFSLLNEPYPAAALLELPIEIEVMGQELPVFFALKSIVTSSVVEISEKTIDFGKIFVGQRTSKMITLRNTSMLPQKIAFVRLKKEFQVQPNDGFAVLLPLEEMQFEVSFGPLSAIEYKLDLTVMTSFNDKYVVSVRAEGVTPPLSLSHSVFHMRTTAPGQRVFENLFVTNSLSFPQSFEIMPPPSCFTWIKISPLAMHLQPGETCRVEIEYSPPNAVVDVQSPQQFFEEAARDKAIAETPFDWRTDAGWACAESLFGSVQWALPCVDRIDSGHTETQINDGEDTEEKEKATEDEEVEEQEERVQPLSKELWGVVGKWNFPILVKAKKRANSEVVSSSTEGLVAASTQWTSHKPLPLFVSVETMTTLPQIESDLKELDFGCVAVSTRHLKTFKVYNRTDAVIKLKATGFNAMGPFSLLRPIRAIAPFESRVVIVECFPKVPGLIVEMLEIQTENESLGGHRLYIPCSVQGLMPVIALEGLLPPPPDTDALLAFSQPHREKWSSRSGVLDFGHVLVSSSPEHNVTVRKFVVRNQSSFPIDTIISRAAGQGLPSRRKREELIERTAAGLPVIAVRPEHVKIQPNSSAEIEVIFRADRGRLLPFREDFEVAVGTTDERLRVGVLGRAWTRQFVVIPDSPLDEPMLNNWLRATAGATEDVLANHCSLTVRQASASALSDLLTNVDEPLNPTYITLQFPDPFDPKAPSDSYVLVDAQASNAAAGGKNAKGAKEATPVNPEGAQRRQVKKLRIVTAKSGIEAVNAPTGAKGPPSSTFEVVFSEAAKASGLWSLNVEKGNAVAGKDEIIEIICTQPKPRMLGGVSVCSWKSFDATVIIKGGLFLQGEKEENEVNVKLLAFVSI